ncbi:putative lipoprotein [Bordetella bronchiseptica GA96-01]|uniref:hypothetical protein n=1 Tax=Bordetella bronchiseptica TaxID=518 RepID=UPI00045A81D8|nr:hypothetical protein [Bordetella bronchiseptica]AZW29404.1 hypothetical protein CS343_03825 [Bordetella bronchiseptica]KCV39692.1 putative lipoprotein [Bordetella bronchiseptica 345]KDC40854.1 putative lipoprotein [Bordetella bronchiseptica GA96-01]
MLKTLCKTALAAGAALGLAGACAAQGAKTHLAMAEMGGTMHAAAQACGDYKPAELSDMKARQQQAMAGMGVSAEQFETAFAAGLEKGRQQIAGASAQQKQQMCEQLRAMPRQ